MSMIFCVLTLFTMWHKNTKCHHVSKTCHENLKTNITLIHFTLTEFSTGHQKIARKGAATAIRPCGSI